MLSYIHKKHTHTEDFITFITATQYVHIQTGCGEKKAMEVKIKEEIVGKGFQNFRDVPHPNVHVRKNKTRGNNYTFAH